MPHILSFSPTHLINSRIHEHSCKILYFLFIFITLLLCQNQNCLKNLNQGMFWEAPWIPHWAHFSWHVSRSIIGKISVHYSKTLIKAHRLRNIPKRVLIQPKFLFKGNEWRWGMFLQLRRKEFCFSLFQSVWGISERETGENHGESSGRGRKNEAKKETTAPALGRS